MSAVCREPGCFRFRPCELHPEPDRRSPSSRITGTHRWRTLKAKVLRRDHYRCQLRLDCCQGVATTADHIRPVSKGGDPWDPANLQAACTDCNARKNGRYRPTV